MANEQNLIHVKKGQILNPAGRPVGSKNRSTVLRELLELMIEREDLSGNELKMTVEQAIIQALIAKGLSGDTQAIKEVLDTRYGKLTDKVETTLVDKPLQETDNEIINRYLTAQGIKTIDHAPKSKEPK